MKIEDIRREIEELSSLIALWQEGSAPKLIEQDLALSKLSKLYEGVKFLSLNSEVPQSDEASSEPQAYVADDSIFSIDIDGVSLAEPTPIVRKLHKLEPVNEEKEEVKEEKEEPAPVPEIEPTSILEPETEAEPEVEEPSEVAPKDSNCESTLFDIAPLPKRSRRGRRSVLMSLYEDNLLNSNDSVESKSIAQSDENNSNSALQDFLGESKAEELPIEEPKVEITTIEEPKVEEVAVGSFETAVQTLGDTLASQVETVSDRLSVDVPLSLADERSMCRSIDSLGINDRYLLTRDLFGDDPHLCKQELDAINAFDNYEDAMIYIAENFDWSGESEGAKLLLAVLENKFSIS